MTALSIQAPFPIITDIDGQPLEDGFIWIGVANLPPIGNPITVYWDAALTQPAALPVRTLGGYPMNSGTPGRLYVNSNYSILVQNKNGSTVYSAPAATERLSGVVIEVDATDVSFIQAGLGAVTRTAQAKMRDVVSVKDFGAVGDGITDDTIAIQNALNQAAGGEIYFPKGTYLVFALKIGANTVVNLNGVTIKKRPVTGLDPQLGTWTGASQGGTGSTTGPGGGPVFWASNQYPPVFFLAGNDILIKDGIIDGNWQSETIATSASGGSFSAQTDRSGILGSSNAFRTGATIEAFLTANPRGDVSTISSVTDCTISNVQFKNMGGACINLEMFGQVIVDGCSDENSYSGFAFVTCDTVGPTNGGYTYGWLSFTNNVMKQSTRVRQANRNPAVLDRKERITIEGNIFDNSYAALSWSVSSLTQTAGVATATTTTPHGLVTGTNVQISGATPSGYNTTAATVTVTGANTFTYSVSGALASPATGTIVAAAPSGAAKIQEIIECSISNNVFSDCALTPQSNASNFGRTLNISGNTFYASTPSLITIGIVMGASRTQTLNIVNNNFTNAYITFQRGSSVINVSNNTFRCTTNCVVANASRFVCITGGATGGQGKMMTVANNVADLGDYANHMFLEGANEGEQGLFIGNYIANAHAAFYWNTSSGLAGPNKLSILSNVFDNCRQVGRINANNYTSLLIKGNQCINASALAAGTAMIGTASRLPYINFDSVAFTTRSLVISENYTDSSYTADAWNVLGGSGATITDVILSNNIFYCFDGGATCVSMFSATTVTMTNLVVMNNLFNGNLAFGAANTITNQYITGNSLTDVGGALRVITNTTRKAVDMTGILSTTIGGAGAASALPATPEGYVTTVVNGVNQKIPYYNA